MVNLSAFQDMTPQETAYYSSLGGRKTLYTTHKNREIRRQMEMIQPGSTDLPVQAQVQVMQNLGLEAWNLIWEMGGWYGYDPYPYPARAAPARAPQPAPLVRAAAAPAPLLVAAPRSPPPQPHHPIYRPVIPPPHAVVPHAAAAVPRPVQPPPLRQPVVNRQFGPGYSVPAQAPHAINPPAPRQSVAGPSQPQAHGFSRPAQPVAVPFRVAHASPRNAQPVAGPSRLGYGVPRPPSPASREAQLPPGLDRQVIRDGRVVYQPAEVSSPAQGGLRRLDAKGKFREKLRRFYAKPEMQKDDEGRCEFLVSRSHILQHGINALTTNTPAQLKKLLIIKFHGEEGDDAGGLSKEFFHLLSKELFSPDYGLFVTSETTYTTCINPMSGFIDPDHETLFTLFGRCVALSIFHHRLINVHFAPHFYKSILGIPLTLADMKDVDPALHKSLEWMTKHSIEGILDETFSYEEEQWGELVTVPVITGGERIAVTDLNKPTFVSMRVQHQLLGRVKSQFDAFLKGFDDIIPRQLLRDFSPSELEALIAGTNDVDVDDWRSNTELENYSMASPPIVWFWQVVQDWSTAERSKFLQWVTGSSRVPTAGFSELRGGGEPRKFKITQVGSPTALPACHTCFNRLDLPPYASFATLKQKLNFAIQESQGFAVA